MGGDLPTGITVYDGSGTISNNLIIDIVNNNGQAHGPDAAYGMIIMSSNDSVECYNNMIYHVAAGNAYGIYTHTVSSLSEFYYNSIYLCEDNSQYLENVTKSYCFLIDGLDKGSRFFMKNNILLNNFGDIYGQPVTDATCLGIRNVADDLVPLLNNKMNITHNIFYADEIPPFNITVSFANEYGQKATLVIYGVEILNEAIQFGIDNVTTEKAYTFVARKIDYMRAYDPGAINTGSGNETNKGGEGDSVASSSAISV